MARPSILHGRHQTGAVLAAVMVAASVVIGVWAPVAASWSWLLVAGMLGLVGVAACISARWSLVGLAGAVAVLWWAVRESLRRGADARQPSDALDGVGYVLLAAAAVLGLLAIVAGAAIGWFLRRRRRAPTEEGHRQVVIG